MDLDLAANKFPKQDALEVIEAVVRAVSTLACSRGVDLVEAIPVRLRGSDGRVLRNSPKSRECASQMYL